MQPPSNSATPQSTSFALVLVLSLLHLKLKLKLCSQVDAKSLFELGGVASSLSRWGRSVYRSCSLRWVVVGFSARCLGELLLLLDYRSITSGWIVVEEPKLCNRLTTDLVVSRFGDHFFGFFSERKVLSGCCSGICGKVLLWSGVDVLRSVDWSARNDSRVVVT